MSSILKKLIKAAIRLFLRLLSPENKMKLINYIVINYIDYQNWKKGAYSDGTRNRQKMYQAVLSNYEKNYDPKYGGWKNPVTSEIEYASVELEVAQTWYALTKLLKPVHILETGVFSGYSTCYISAALEEMNNGGHIYCIDPQIIPHLWEKTELESYITWFPKFSQDTLEDVKHIDFDLLVLDSYHDYKTVIWELINFEPLLKENGHILMHDTQYFDGVGAAVKQLYENSRFDVITIDSPRTHGIKGGRCPGISIVRKIKHGNPIVFEEKYEDWFIGKASKPAFLKDYLENKLRDS
jgi:predicted O-methyltransferase YrrM